MGKTVVGVWQKPQLGIERESHLNIAHRDSNQGLDGTRDRLRPSATAVRFRFAVPLLLLAASSAQWGCYPSSQNPTVPESVSVDTVVLISIDSLRADRVGVYGNTAPTSPAIDRIAERGTVFERAYSTSSWTLPAHAAMMTGRYDEVHGAFDDGEVILPAVPLLAEVLTARGIRADGFYGGPYLAPDYGFGRGFTEYISATSYDWGGPSDGEKFPHFEAHVDVTNPRLIERMRTWLQSKPKAERNFIFIHMWDVHYDFIAPQLYVDMMDPEYEGSITGEHFVYNLDINPNMAPRDLEHVFALYDAEIRYTDDTLETLVNMLRKAGLMENAAIIVTADHGEEFFEHGQKSHRLNLYEEVLRVPLVIAVEGVTHPVTRTDTVVSLVDIFPTVCDLFSIDCNYQGTGTSLLRESGLHSNAAEAERSPQVFAELTTRVFHIDQDAVVRSDDKLIRDHTKMTRTYYGLSERLSEHDGITVETDELATYSSEVRSALDLLVTHTKSAIALGDELRRADAAPTLKRSKVREEHLRSLGYIE